ncbi:hypothetical protein KEM54_000580 [Ascosphaera aggregata]|nr:hypothetical protein KEM54_000580 [Ascosphaera aggregata]
MGPRFVLNRESSIDTTGLDDIDDHHSSGALSQDSGSDAVERGILPEVFPRDSKDDESGGFESPILGSLDSPRQYCAYTEDQWRSQDGRPLPAEGNDDQAFDTKTLDFRRRHILPPTPTQIVDRQEDPILDSSPPLPSASGYNIPRAIITQAALENTIGHSTQKRKYDYSSEDEEEVMSPTARRTPKTSLFSSTPILQQSCSSYWNVLRSTNPSVTQQNKRFVFLSSQHAAQPNNILENENSTTIPKSLKPILPSTHLHQTSTIDYGDISPIESKTPKESVTFIQGGLAAGLRSWIIDADARKSAIHFAIDNSADDDLTRNFRSGKPIPAADEKRYALVATVDSVQNDDRDESVLNTWCPARHTLVSATRHLVNAEGDLAAPEYSVVPPLASSPRQNILLLGLPRQDWRNREKRFSTGHGRLATGDVIGLRHGLIWDIKVPNPALRATFAEGMKSRDPEEPKAFELTCIWVVAFEWDILMKES